MKNLLLTLLIVLLATTAQSAEYFIRTDGGDSTRCTGLADAIDPGSGTAQACAWNHPFWALKPVSGTLNIAGGDIVTFSTTGGTNSYEMGYDSGVDVGACTTGLSVNCYMQPIPSGSDGSPTIFRGDTWNTGCASPPELWGSSSARRIINVHTSDWIELRCLEITDHDSCAMDVGLDKCSKDMASGGLEYGRDGVVGHGGDNVILEDLNIHGLASMGIVIGPNGTDTASNWTFTNTTMRSNAWAGISIADRSSDVQPVAAVGNMDFDNVDIIYNGCHEDYPIVSGLEVENCFGQDVGGYGDGLGTSATSGDWTFIDSSISHNTSDGLDLLYVNNTGTATIKRSLFEGNSGNQVKITSPTYIEDSIIIGNCAYHEDNNLVQPTWGQNQTCRAQGSALGLVYSASNQTMTVVGTTIIGAGDTIAQLSGRNYTCNGTETFQSYNNIWVGSTDRASGGGDQTVWVYSPSCPNAVRDFGSSDSNIIYHMRNSPCDSGDDAGIICPEADPGLNIAFGAGNGDVTCTDVHNCDATIALIGNPPVGAGENVVGDDDLDYTGGDRGATHDIGAYDFSTAAAACGDACSLCATQTPCEASAATDCNGTGFCCWNAISSACQVTACDTTCGTCADQTTCEAASASCFWWTDSTCHTTAEPATCAAACPSCLDQSACEASAASCDWSPESAKEDFSLYTEADPANDITVATFDITVDTMQQGVIANVCSPELTDGYGDFIHEVDVTTSVTAATQLIGIWAVNEGSQSIDAMNSTLESGYVLSYGTSGGSAGYYLEYFGDNTGSETSNYAGDSFLTAVGSTHYILLTRTGTTMEAKFYTDDNPKTTLVDTLSITGDAVPLDYVCGILNRGVVGTAEGSLTVNNLLLNSSASCVVAAANTCDDDCTLCVTQQGCEGSTQTCYWWTTNACNTTVEPPPPVNASDSLTGGSATGGGFN